MRVSRIAAGLQTSPIITLAAEINEKIERGEKVANLTIGDFNPRIFPIPAELRDEIIAAYRDNQTNYPGAKGLQPLRDAVSGFLQSFGGLNVDAANILISSGSRPLIYSCYHSVVNAGERCVFPVPSWNNDYYTLLCDAHMDMVETRHEGFFMPRASDLEPYLQNAALLALCSPLNPTGTVFDRENLRDICELVIAENRRRGAGAKPLYVLFDQIYWLLTFGDTEHHNALAICPEIEPYAIFIDGLSKAFAGTGVRVGWAFGPTDIIAKMRTVVAHMGAWAPKPEQVAAGKYLADHQQVETHLNSFRSEIQARLNGFHKGFMRLRENGHPVDAIEPQAAIYLTVQIDCKGRRTAAGEVLATNDAVHRYVLDEARIGLVPFSYFGASEESSWYRLSVGTCRMEEVELIMSNLESALSKLS